MKHILEIGSASTAGQRQQNEDRLCHFDSPFGTVFVLADGMGGYQGGALASSIAISRFPALLREQPPSADPASALRESIHQVNQAILDAHREGNDAMGTTIVALLIRQTDSQSLALGTHVGDSRLYFQRNQGLFCLTRDHTAVQELVDRGVLTPEQAQDHPRANVLTRALGRDGLLEIDVTSWMLLKPGDTFLLCSDGLSGYAEDAAIAGILARHHPAPALAQALVDLAIRKESDDNISVLVVRIADFNPS